jgi:hypothetical protein
MIRMLLVLTAVVFLARIGRADTVVEMTQTHSGYNIYGSSVMYDQQEQIYKMWYMGWQVSGEVNDRIYYSTSLDGKNWGPSQTVFSPFEMYLEHGAVPIMTHTGDPSVTKHYNSISGQYQYTMFYTACHSPCSELPGNNENEIWSIVSSDGIHWSYPIPLLWGVIGPAEPSAIIDNAGNVFWKVYYADRLEADVIKMAKVDGNRNAISVESAYWHAGPGVISGPEVRYINGKWTLFFNDLSGDGSTLVRNIHKVTSAINTHWPTGAQPLIASGYEPGQGCSVATPGVLAFGPGDPLAANEYLLYFGLGLRDANGSCSSSRHVAINGWRWISED